MTDDVHPEDRKNTTVVAAARHGGQVELTWPDDLATARYLWRKLGGAIAEASFTGEWEPGADDYLAAEVVGDQLRYSVPSDLALARYLQVKLDMALSDSEWRLYVEASKLRADVFAREAQRVQLGDARTLKRHLGGRN